jgi:hypothetical protein
MKKLVLCGALVAALLVAAPGARRRGRTAFDFCAMTDTFAA